MTTINSTLSVSSTGVVSCTPECVTATQANTTLVYTLDAASAVVWKITELTNTDRLEQLGPYTITPDGSSVSMNDVNTQSETFNITVIVHHRKTGERIGIDPVVINDPE